MLYLHMISATSYNYGHYHYDDGENINHNDIIVMMVA